MQNKWMKRGRMLQKEIETSVPRAGEVFAWYLGQVGYVFKGRKTVAVDPFLNDLTDEAGVSRRLYAPPFDGSMLPADYVLITHGHDDHMALPTLTQVKNAMMIVPEMCAEELKAAGIPAERIITAKAKQRIELDGVTILPVQAAHPVHTEDGDYALCYEIRMNGVTLIHLGDTYLTDRLRADLLSLDTPDAFFPPINGGDYYRTARNCIGNLNAAEAAALASELRARVTVPTHYDMMIGNTTEPFEFIRELKKENPAAAVRLPVLGEKTVFEASGIELRRAEIRDLDTVTALYAEAIGTPGCTWNEFYPTHADAYDDVMAGCLYVYTLHGETVGAASIVPKNELDDISCWQARKGSCREIARVVVSNDCRGNGLATDMTAEILKVLRRQGFGGVHLLAAVRNPAAVAVYENLGFRRMNEVEMYDNRYYAMELCFC